MLDRSLGLEGACALTPNRHKTDRAIPRGRVAGAFFALCLLAGCAGGGNVVYNTNFTSGYSAMNLSAMRQALPVETFGTPAPGLSQESVTAATIEGLRKHGPNWIQLSYSGNPEDRANAPYRLRFAYNAAQGFPRMELCRDDFQASEVGRGDSGRLVMALCRDGRYVAMGEGSPGTDVDITSDAFEEFVGLMGRRVMPRQRPGRTRSRGE